MSRSELIEAYVRGGIDRRTFLKGMAALGASVTTAALMADSLQAAPTNENSLSASFQGDDDDDDDDDGIGQLPNTGIGDSNTSNGLLGAVAVGGVAAAAASVLLRKKDQAENSGVS